MGKRELSGTEKRTIQQTRGNGVQHLQWARNSACSHQPDWKTSYSWDFKKSTWKGHISVVREVIPRLLLLLLRHSVVSDFVRPQRRQPTRLRCPWDSPGKNTVVGCHFLLQGIFLTQELNPGLPWGGKGRLFTYWATREDQVLWNVNMYYVINEFCV